MSGFHLFSLSFLPFVEVCVSVTILAVLLRSTLRYLKRRKDDQQQYKHPGGKETHGMEAIPQLKPAFPILGNIPLIFPIKTVLSKLIKWCDTNGEIFKFCGANQTFVLLNSAELVQTLLKSGDFGHIAKSHFVYGKLEPFATNGVLVSKGHFWKGQRKILMKSQSYSNLKAYMEMLNKHGRKMVADLQELYKDEQPKPANDLISRTFLNLISEMVTGYGTESNEELNRYHHHSEIGKEVITNRILQPWLMLNAIWMWSPLKQKFDKAIEEAFEFGRRKLDKHKLERENLASANCIGGSSTFRSVLDELVDAGLEDQQIFVEVNTMLFAGHDTVAGAIHFFCLTMALNQECQAKCRQEIDALIEEKGDMAFTLDDMQGGLKYLERCISETLRLFPPVFIFFRQLESPLCLNYNGKSLVLPIGTNITVTPLALQRKPKYFPEPELFNPDRFLPEEVAKRHAYAYIPFSAGPRSCLGMKFAMIEMKTIAAYMLHNFEIETTDKMEDISLLPYFILEPGKTVVFTFKKRTWSECLLQASKCANKQ